MQVSYAPSLSALREMRKLRVPTGRLNSSLVAYASPSLSKDFNTRVELAYAGTKLESTAEQEQEIREAAAIYGTTNSRVFSGAEANEERISSELSRARILHFAAPTVLDDTSPMSSFIALSSTSRQDGFFQAREILNLQTSVELVVLSRAQRRGDLNGSGPVGFSWSWFVAGGPSTMLSRWTVDSPAQSQLFTKFYAAIKPSHRGSISKARALHQSLMSVRRSAAFEHPYYWANYSMIGDTR